MTETPLSCKSPWLGRDVTLIFSNWSPASASVNATVKSDSISVSGVFSSVVSVKSEIEGGWLTGAEESIPSSLILMTMPWVVPSTD